MLNKTCLRGSLINSLDAGIDQLTWHDWRRTLASDRIDQGDLAGAQLTLGHSSPTVTMRYSRREMKIVQHVLSKRRTPYVGRSYDR